MKEQSMNEPIQLFKGAAGEYLSKQRVEEIIECEQQADRHQEISEEFRWKAAELIAAELEDGKAQQQLADEIGKSRAHVRLMAITWTRNGHLGARERSSFNEAYQQAKKSEAQLDEEARLTAVSYRTVLYEPGSLMLALFAGTSVEKIARHMQDFPDYATLSRSQLIELGTALVALGHAS
jgi:hypothetical protein